MVNKRREKLSWKAWIIKKMIDFNFNPSVDLQTVSDHGYQCKSNNHFSYLCVMLLHFMCWKMPKTIWYLACNRFSLCYVICWALGLWTPTGAKQFASCWINHYRCLRKEVKTKNRKVALILFPLTRQTWTKIFSGQCPNYTGWPTSEKWDFQSFLHN